MKQKAFFFTFKGLSIAKNRLRPKSASLSKGLNKLMTWFIAQSKMF